MFSEQNIGASAYRFGIRFNSCPIQAS